MIDMTMEPEQWTIEDKADILVDFGIVSFGLVQYQRKIILIGGLRGSNAGGTASVFSKQVLIYYLDQDRYSDAKHCSNIKGMVFQMGRQWCANLIFWICPVRVSLDRKSRQSCHLVAKTRTFGSL